MANFYLANNVTIISAESDGASAVAHQLDTMNTFSTSGAVLLRLSNNNTNIFDFSYQGGIDHKNSGATTEAHEQSLNLNWSATGSDTSSGQYSVVIGANNLASAFCSFAQGYWNDVTANNAFAFGGYNNVSGTYSGAFGQNNEVSAPYSCAFGEDSKVYTRATIGLGGEAFANRGDAQSGWSTLKIATSDATQTTMLSAGINYVIQADCSWVFSALVIARSNEADGNDSAAYMLEGCIARDESGNTALVGSVTKTVIAESAGATAWDVTAEADDTGEALAIKVTGEAATNIRWVAKVDSAQVTYT